MIISFSSLCTLWQYFSFSLVSERDIEITNIWSTVNISVKFCDCFVFCNVLTSILKILSSINKNFKCLQYIFKGFVIIVELYDLFCFVPSGCFYNDKSAASYNSMWMFQRIDFKLWLPSFFGWTLWNVCWLQSKDQ